MHIFEGFDILNDILKIIPMSLHRDTIKLVDEEHPLLFKPFEILGLFGYASSEAGYGAPPSDVFKSYCGV
ncbi:hypothetical protein H5410_006228 [Solanum commersonii]|uniref:Uncharacterized protein n=1 Tax=Solanum commersonii TaxID=4109 RepID=A0A9J6A9T5_SOLCO|nr:hypothetical protein H5410_006228 [Solanum commersonii]